MKQLQQIHYTKLKRDRNYLLIHQEYERMDSGEGAIVMTCNGSAEVVKYLVDKFGWVVEEGKVTLSKIFEYLEDNGDDSVAIYEL